jgi:hypothetical protein
MVGRELLLRPLRAQSLQKRDATLNGTNTTFDEVTAARFTTELGRRK